MRVVRVSVRDFRSYEDARADFGPGLTLITGPNGARRVCELTVTRAWTLTFPFTVLPG